MHGEIEKSARVYSNDPKNPVIRVTIKANIKPLISQSYKAIDIRGNADQEITKLVTIQTDVEKSLTLEEKSFDLSSKVKYRIDEITPGKIFDIYFTNIPGPKENYSGTLKLKTNYPKKPEIVISINARFK